MPCPVVLMNADCFQFPNGSVFLFGYDFCIIPLYSWSSSQERSAILDLDISPVILVSSVLRTSPVFLHSHGMLYICSSLLPGFCFRF
jgi:hypothetical protein